MCRKNFLPNKAKKLHVDRPENVDDHKEVDLLQRMAVSWESPLDQLTELMMEVDVWLSGRTDDACVALRRCRTALSRHVELKDSAREHDRTVRELTEQLTRLSRDLEFERQKYQVTEDAQVQQITTLTDENAQLKSECEQAKANLEQLKNLCIQLQLQLHQAQTQAQNQGYYGSSAGTQPQNTRNPLPAPPEPIPLGQLPTLAQAAAEPKYSALYSNGSIINGHSAGTPVDGVSAAEGDGGKKHRKRREHREKDKDKERGKGEERSSRRTRASKEREHRDKEGMRERERGDRESHKERERSKDKDRRPHHPITDEEIVLPSSRPHQQTRHQFDDSSSQLPSSSTNPQNHHVRERRSRTNLAFEEPEPQPPLPPRPVGGIDDPEPVDVFSLASVYLKEFASGMVNGHMAVAGMPLPLTPGPIVHPDLNEQGGSGSGGRKKKHREDGYQTQSGMQPGSAGTPSRTSRRNQAQAQETPTRHNPTNSNTTPTRPSTTAPGRDRSNSRSRERHVPPRLQAHGMALQNSLSSSTATSTSGLGYGGYPPPPVPPLPSQHSQQPNGSGFGPAASNGYEAMGQSTSSLLTTDTSSSSGVSTIRPGPPPQAFPQQGWRFPPASAPVAGPSGNGAPGQFGPLGASSSRVDNPTAVDDAPPVSAPATTSASISDPIVNGGINAAMPRSNPPAGSSSNAAHRHDQRMSIVSNNSVATWATIESKRSNMTQGSVMSGLVMFRNDFVATEGGVPPELATIGAGAGGVAGDSGAGPSGSGAGAGVGGGIEGQLRAGGPMGLGLTFGDHPDTQLQQAHQQHEHQLNGTHQQVQQPGFGYNMYDEQRTPSSRRISILSGGASSIGTAEREMMERDRSSLVLENEIMNGEARLTMSPDPIRYGGRGRAATLSASGDGEDVVFDHSGNGSVGVGVVRSGSPARRVETMEGVLPSANSRRRGHGRDLLSHGHGHGVGSGSTVGPAGGSSMSSSATALGQAQAPPLGASSRTSAAPLSAGANPSGASAGLFTNPFYGQPSNGNPDGTQGNMGSASMSPTATTSVQAAPLSAPATVNTASSMNRFYRSSTSMDVRPSTSASLYDTSTSRGYFRNGLPSAFRINEEEPVDEFGAGSSSRNGYGALPVSSLPSRSQGGGYQTDVEGGSSSYHRHRERERREERDGAHRSEHRDKQRDSQRQRDRERERQRPRERDPHRARPGRVLPLPEGSPFPITDENAEEEEAAAREQLQNQAHVHSTSQAQTQPQLRPQTAQQQQQQQPRPTYNPYAPHPYPAPPAVQTHTSSRSQGGRAGSPSPPAPGVIYGNPLRPPSSATGALGHGLGHGAGHQSSTSLHSVHSSSSGVPITPVPSRRHVQQQQQGAGGLSNASASGTPLRSFGNALGLDLNTHPPGQGVGISAPTPANAGGQATQGFLRNWNRDG